MRESWQAEYPAQGCELAHPNICLVFQQLEQEKGTHLQIHNQRIYKTSNNGREVQGPIADGVTEDRDLEPDEWLTANNTSKWRWKK